MNSELNAPISDRSQMIRSVLIAILIAGFISGAVTGFYAAGNTLEPMWFDVVSTIAILFLVLTWYHIDSNAHGYQRSLWLNFLILGFAAIGVPYYLMRSRSEGKKLRAIWLMLGFFLTLCVVSVAGEFLAALIF